MEAAATCATQRLSPCVERGFPETGRAHVSGWKLRFGQTDGSRRDKRRVCSTQKLQVLFCFFQLMYCCKSTLEAPYATCDEVCFECVDNVHGYKRFFFKKKKLQQPLANPRFPTRLRVNTWGFAAPARPSVMDGEDREEAGLTAA